LNCSGVGHVFYSYPIRLVFSTVEQPLGFLALAGYTSKYQQ